VEKGGGTRIFGGLREQRDGFQFS